MKRLSAKLQVFFIAAIGLLCSASIGWTQTTGTLLGSVTDPSGGVIVGAKVILTHQGTGDQRNATTDTGGSFTFPSLLPGAYKVRIEAQGFRPFEKIDNALSANDRLSLGNIALTVGTVGETITVTAQGAAVQTASSEGSAVLTSTQLDTIAQKGRVLTNYLLLLPGVATNTGTLDAASGFITIPNANGLSNQTMTISIDGLQGEDLGSQQLFTTSINPDAVAEIKVLMNNYQAEYGRNGGATVNIITKSGTKDFHGSAYYFKRHEMFNANSFFNNRQGLAKAKYRFNTRGVTIGGPITIPGLFNTRKEKLFFFYNYDDSPSTSTPATPANTTLPTTAERNGDYSDSRNPGGTLIAVRDPLANANFANNIIPASRINKQGQILLNVFTSPNQLNRAVTAGQYNNQFLNIVPNVRPGHVFRVDYNVTPKDTIYFRGARTNFQSIKSSVTTWDFARNSFSAINKTAVFGWTRIVSPSMVNEFTAGIRRPLEVTRMDDNKAFRKTYNFTAGQFHPEINYADLLPLVSYTGAGLQNTPSFGNWQAGRYPQNEADLLLYFQDGFTITRRNHNFKMGIYAEKDRISTGTGFQSLPYGSFSFNADTTNPNDARHPFANALLGNFQNYSESQVRTRPAGVAINVDWYVQDSWKVNKRLTLELGMRVAYFTPWWGWHGTSTSFAPERYDRSKAPLLYQPVISNGVRSARNPVNGQILPVAFIGAFVPGTGDPGNGTVTSADKNYPRGFYENAGELLQPRFGFAYDVFGEGKTAIRGGYSLQHQSARYEPGAAGAPINYTPLYYFGSLDTFLNASGTLSPGTVTGHVKDRKTPAIHNISFGIQHDLGKGTVMEAKYVSTLGRNLPTTRNISTLPYGATFVDLNPQNQDPGAGANVALSQNFLTPTPGWTGITMREAGGSSNYHALQASANRRFTHGLQFGGAYTYSKTMDYGATMPIYRNARQWNYGKTNFDQTHVLTINYTYDLPDIGKRMSNRLVGAVMDNWEISGITSFASGVPNGITLQFSPAADFTGGGDGNRVNVIGDPRLSHGERGFDRMFNTAAFAMPTFRAANSGAPVSIGNAPSEMVRGPGVNNWDLTLFKNIPLAEERTLQLRWEMYNIFNKTQFNTMNTTATFNASGTQTNTSFGQATGARPDRFMQVSLRFRF